MRNYKLVLCASALTLAMQPISVSASEITTDLEISMEETIEKDTEDFDTTIEIDNDNTEEEIENKVNTVVNDIGTTVIYGMTEEYGEIVEDKQNAYSNSYNYSYEFTPSANGVYTIQIEKSAGFDLSLKSVMLNGDQLIFGNSFRNRCMSIWNAETKSYFIVKYMQAGEKNIFDINIKANALIDSDEPYAFIVTAGYNSSAIKPNKDISEVNYVTEDKIGYLKMLDPNYCYVPRLWFELIDIDTLKPVDQYACGQAQHLFEFKKGQRYVWISDSGMDDAATITYDLPKSGYYYIAQPNLHSLSGALEPSNKKIEWKFDDKTNTLYLDGEDEIDVRNMYVGNTNYTRYLKVFPWYMHKDKIEHVVIGSKIKYIDQLVVDLGEGLEPLDYGAFENYKAIKDITFLGDAPRIGGSSFWGLNITCYYPAYNTTWTKNVMSNYSGDITWKINPKTVATPKLSAPIVSGNGIALKWSKVDNVATYRVFRKVADGKWTKLKDVTGTTLTDASAESGISYSYTVRGLDKSGNYVTDYDKSGVKATFIAKPVLTNIANATDGVKITWGKVAGAEKYRLYRKVAGGSWAKVADTTSTSYTDKTAKSGTEYFYTVRCVTADGSKTVSAYDTTGFKIAYVAKPTISSVSNTVDGVSVSWGKIDGAAKYRVYLKNAEGKWTKLKDTTSTKYIDKDVESGSTYQYTIRCIAVDGTTMSAYDSVGKTITFIAAPVISSVSNTTKGVKVVWGKVTGAAKYRVFRKTTDGSWKKLTDTTSLSYVDTTAVKGTKYYYTVRCINSDGTSYTSAYDTTGKVITAK